MEQNAYEIELFWGKYIVHEILNCVVSNKIGRQSIAHLLKDQGKSSVAKKTDSLIIECGICFKPLSEIPQTPSENSISCNSCKHWFHASCTNITEMQFFNDDLWICTFCSNVDFVISKD